MLPFRIAWEQIKSRRKDCVAHLADSVLEETGSQLDISSGNDLCYRSLFLL